MLGLLYCRVLPSNPPDKSKHAQELSEECVTAQQLLMDHVKACCTKRVSIQALAVDVRQLKADVQALHALLRARVAAQAEQEAAERTP